MGLLLLGAQANAQDAEDTVRYRGFGGISYGFVGFFDRAKPDKGQRAVELGDEGGSQALGSECLLRIADSRWFAGYSVALQGGAAFSRSLSVFNTSRSTKSPACGGEQCFGLVETTYVDVLHVPIEANTAHVWDVGKFNFWVGGGPSIHLLKFTAYNSANAVQVLDPDNQDDPANNTATSAITEQQGRSRKFGGGFQVMGGTGFEFGKLPQIGGRWGLTLNVKYQIVKNLEQILSG
jgi:hypothetical protein